MSIADISAFGLEQIVGKSCMIKSRFAAATETRDRVKNVYFLETVSVLQSVIVSLQKLKMILQENIVNTDTSITTDITKALVDIGSAVQSDIFDKGSTFLLDYQNCYNEEVDYVIQYYNGQLASLIQSLSFTQIVCRRYPNITDDEYAILNSSSTYANTVNKLMSDTYNVLANLENDFCPMNFFDQSCYQLNHFLYIDGGEAFTYMGQYVGRKWNGTAYSIVYDSLVDEEFQFKFAVHLANYVEQGMLNMTKCVLKYSQLLNDFTAFLATKETIEIGLKTRNTLLYSLNDDEKWLRGLLDSYVDDRILKQDLVLVSDRNQLVSNIQNVNIVVDQSVITNLNSLTASITSSIASNYLAMLGYLSRLQTYVGLTDSRIENFARGFYIWRKPVYSPVKVWLSNIEEYCTVVQSLVNNIRICFASSFNISSFIRHQVGKKRELQNMKG